METGCRFKIQGFLSHNVDAKTFRQGYCDFFFLSGKMPKLRARKSRSPSAGGTKQSEAAKTKDPDDN